MTGHDATDRIAGMKRDASFNHMPVVGVLHQVWSQGQYQHTYYARE